MSLKRAILIAGPTASGKSEVALHVAEALDGVIINADSMQVYADLKTITARPAADKTQKIPHALYGVAPAAAPFSVAAWLGLAEDAAQKAQATGKIPIFTGGTGLYFRALLKGLADVPEVPAEVRARLRQKLETEGTRTLYQSLAEKDPVTADRLKPRDKQRILRALEVFEATGRPLSAWQQNSQKGFLEQGNILKICLEIDRDALEQRIRRRFQDMVSAGALEEASRFAAKGLDKDLPAMKALGLRPLMRHAAGEISLDEAINLAVIESRQYAKRQRTWFRGQFSDWIMIAAGKDAAGKIVSLAKDVFRD